MWSDSYEVVGAKLWKQLLRGYGHPQDSIESAPGLLFEESDVDDQRAFLTVLMLFQWDATLVPEHGKYFVRISHDGYVQFTARDEPTSRALAVPVDAWKETERRK
jgi:hypothetical protein